MSKHTLLLGRSARKLGLWIQAAVLVSAGLLPLTFGSTAYAATDQLSTRSVASSTAVPSAAVGLVFTFTTTNKSPAPGNIDKIELEFCDTPLGTCTGDGTPASFAAADQIPSIVNNTPTGITLGGGFAGTGLTFDRVNGDHGGTENQIDIAIGTPANENNKASLTITIPSTQLTNDDDPNVSYYPRIRLLSTSGATEEWYGAVAQSTSQTLTVNARVQEILQFCVGSTAVDDATTAVPADCSTVTGTSVDLGVINSAAVNTTPVATTDGGDLNNAIAMVQTNAVNGVTISYKAIQDTSSGKLKVIGATCSGVATTDQCFNSQGTTQGTFTAGTERFGMTIGGVNCSSVPVSAYTCTFASGLTNLQPLTNYIGGTYVNNTSGTFGSGTGFAWDDTGTAQTIASSASSATKVVAYEALILKFAATAGITTPTGQYQTQADFIATPTY